MAKSEAKSQAVGHIPSGLFIVCSKEKGTDRVDGFLGSFIQQISFEPLLVSLAVKPGRPSSDSILDNQIFTINVVGDHDKNYMKHFWSGYDAEKKPFDEIDHEVTSDGAVILKQAKSTIVCRAKEISQPGDHHLVIAEVLESHVHSDEATPLTHIRKDGLSY